MDNVTLSNLDAIDKSDNVTAQAKVIHFFNANFKEPVDLEKLKAEYHNNLKETQLLEAQVSGSTPSLIQNATSNADKCIARVQGLQSGKELLLGDVSNNLADTKSLVQQLSELVRQIRELEKYSRYLQCIGRIQDLSSDVQSSLIIEAIDRAVDHFSRMAELVRSIQDSKCTHMTEYANDTLVFWYNILKDRLASDFEETLKSFGWPFIMTSVKSSLSTTQNATEMNLKLETLFKHLLHLQLPDSLAETIVSQRFASRPDDCPLLLLPIELMMMPLKKRFHYHFSGKKPTNLLEKPEWYLTQCLNWIRDHREFLHTKIQPIMDYCNVHHTTANVEFIRGLVMLVMEKMGRDVTELLNDDLLFSHLVDEALVFDQELHSVYGYPSGQLTCLHVFLDQATFQRWIRIEEKFALEKMDDLMSSPTAWELQYRDLSDLDDDHKVSECGESFVTLLQAMTERSKCIPWPQHRLLFLQLQLELLDNFRIRLLQVKHDLGPEPTEPRFCAILGTADYLVSVLRHWSELLFFLRLQHYKDNKSDFDDPKQMGDVQLQPHKLQNGLLNKTSDKEGSVFEEMIQFYEHIKSDMLSSIVSYVTDDVTARSRPYRRDKWLAVGSQRQAGGVMGLSSTACEMMLVLREHLSLMQKRLSMQIFNQFWQRLAHDLNEFFYRQVILVNHFSEGGAAQLQFDMRRNLFPLFADYTLKPENYFKDVKEACVLLNLEAGSCELLRTLLNAALDRTDSQVSLSDAKAALQEMGIFRLDSEESRLVLSRRAPKST